MRQLLVLLICAVIANGADIELGGACEPAIDECADGLKCEESKCVEDPEAGPCHKKNLEPKVGVGGTTYRCTEDGQYEPIQCTGSMCYCSDKEGKKIDSIPSVPRKEEESLKCN